MLHLPADDRLDPRLTYNETYLSHWQYWEGHTVMNRKRKGSQMGKGTIVAIGMNCCMSHDTVNRVVLSQTLLVV